MKLNEMKFNENEVRTIYAVFEQMKELGWETSRLGSITFKEMQLLMYKIRYNDYCQRNGILFEDMTEDDIIDAELRECEA